MERRLYRATARHVSFFLIIIFNPIHCMVQQFALTPTSEILQGILSDESPRQWICRPSPSPLLILRYSRCLTKVAYILSSWRLHISYASLPPSAIHLRFNNTRGVIIKAPVNMFPLDGHRKRGTTVASNEFRTIASSALFRFSCRELIFSTRRCSRPLT